MTPSFIEVWRFIIFNGHIVCSIGQEEYRSFCISIKFILADYGSHDPVLRATHCDKTIFNLK